MRLSSVSVSRVTFVLAWIHLLLWPCSDGSKAHGPPSGPPSDGSKAIGPPSDGSKVIGPPSDGSKAHGPPIGPPSDGSKDHGPPSDGSKAHGPPIGPPSDGSKAHSPPSDGSKAHSPPSDGSKAHGPPSDGSKAHGQPSDGGKAHSPPSDGGKAHSPPRGPPSDGSMAHGPPSDGSKAHSPPRGPPSDGSKAHGPPSDGSKAHGPPNGSSPPVRTPGFQGPLESWVRTGFQYLRLALCHGAPRSLPEGWCRGAPRSSLPDGWCRGLSSSLSEGECRRLAQLHMSGVAVYVSDPVESDKVVAILPNSYPPSPGTGGRATAHVLDPPSPGHDGVLVLDPSPGHNFGHPLLVLYLDNNVTKKRCSHMDGIYVGEQCVTVALKGRCRNHLKRCPLGAGRLGGGAMRGLMCEVHFLPLVVGVADKNHTQRLRCVDHPGFSRCPRPLPPMAPPTPSMHQASSCELSENTRRCHVTRPVATAPSCRLYQTCDRAVLLAGTWQHHHVDKLQSFSRMLRSNGLHTGHITTFTGRYPAVQDKAAVRNHISYVCRKQHCADSLVLYLNCPTRCDGAMLLWDHNLNGIAEPQERYSVSELLADLAGCQASRVLVFVDQSYSAVLDKRLRGSQKHRNVALIHRGQHRAPWQQHHHHLHLQKNPTWEEGSWDSIRPGTCLLDHLGKSPGMSRLLQPWAGLLKVTLAGAPCHATPPLTDGETRREYQGCQNLPTALWRRDPSPEPRRPSPKRHYYPEPLQRRYYYYPSPHRKHY